MGEKNSSMRKWKTKKEGETCSTERSGRTRRWLSDRVYYCTSDAGVSMKGKGIRKVLRDE